MAAAFCILHNEKLKLYCLIDKQPICVVCQVSINHKNHDCCPIDEIVLDQKCPLDSVGDDPIKTDALGRPSTSEMLYDRRKDENIPGVSIARPSQPALSTRPKRGQPAPTPQPALSTRPERGQPAPTPQPALSTRPKRGQPVPLPQQSTAQSPAGALVPQTGGRGKKTQPAQTPARAGASSSIGRPRRTPARAGVTVAPPPRSSASEPTPPTVADGERWRNASEPDITPAQFPFAPSRTPGAQQCSEMHLGRTLRYHDILLTEGTPSIYQLNLDLDENGQFKKRNFGRPSPTMKNKTIMILGATGSGKTTLINGMMNYILGVEWDDEWRYKLINEVFNTTQAESQTADITAYQIHHTHTFQIPYSLTIIDTPGFGDTRGIEQDKIITEKIRTFFSHKDGIITIDAVCFVVQSALARLTHTQRYIFDSILSIFGKDIANNIVALVTFADGQKPPVLTAIQEANIPCAKNPDGSTLHFKFNNSALFVSNVPNSEEDDDFEEMFWNMGKKSMKKFFDHVETMDAKSLQQTKEVLAERKRLEVTVDGVQPMIQYSLGKLDKLKSTQKAVQQHQICIDANKDFEYVLDVPKIIKIKLETGIYVTNCRVCSITCHFPCAFSDDGDKIYCGAMNNGTCTVCTGKCRWNEHVNMQYRLEFQTEKKKMTYVNLKEQYESAKGKKMTDEKLAQEIQAEYDKVQSEVHQMIEKVADCLKRLKLIALRPDPLSTPNYIDLMIQSEEQEARPGFMNRIAELQKVRQNAVIVQKVSKGETLDGQEKTTWNKISGAMNKFTGLFK